MIDPTFDNTVQIPIEGATQFPFTSATDFGPPDWNADLAVTHLEVDLHCREVGLVTLAATNDDASSNALGVEFDLQPAAARLLATRLLAAADAADGDEASRAANGVAL